MSWARIDWQSLSLQGLLWIQGSFYGYHTKVKKLSLLYYLSIVGGRIVGFILFLGTLELCEITLFKIWIWFTDSTPYEITDMLWEPLISKMQTASSRNWSLLSKSIFYDDNHHDMCTAIITKVREPSLAYLLGACRGREIHVFPKSIKHLITWFGCEGTTHVASLGHR